ncbi:TPA: 4-(cytidine 5'-diphospho)-2-C-methyl-D-erythritol kinase [Candidatus Bipolaricaulota bacterium]|nr:4-(cytidine 5'-diphospho)-2-C-methyl-D-erythritol kinase [Candidatus Bipolaricaulota bacterium]
MAELRLLAYGKLNLVLRVVGRREDGYHLLRTLMCAVDLADELTLSEAEGISLSTEGLAVPREGNLALRAAQLLAREAGVNKGVHIRLVKKIPSGAGLGGGSADAAAVLAGLNRLWRLGLSRRELQGLGLALGADVPFFLSESPAWAEGIGERLSPARVDLPGAFLVFVPPFDCPTPDVYRLYDELGPPPSRPVRPSGELRFENDLWPAALRLRPQLGELWRALAGLGGLGVGLTGSGAGLFVAFPDPEAAEVAAESLSGEVEGTVFVARPVGRGYKFLG